MTKPTVACVRECKKAFVRRIYATMQIMGRSSPEPLCITFLIAILIFNRSMALLWVIYILGYLSNHDITCVSCSECFLFLMFQS